MANNRTVLNGVAWPDGTVTPHQGMYIGVQDPETLQFFDLPEITLAGDITGTGVTTIQTRLGNTPVIPGTYMFPTITVDSTGRIVFAESGTGVPGVTSVNAVGIDGVTTFGGPITSSGSIQIGLSDITPSTISTGNITTYGNLAFTSGSNVISGEFSNPISTVRAYFQTSTLNSQTVVIARPNGISRVSAWEIENKSPGIDCAGSAYYTTEFSSGIQNYIRGNGVELPFLIQTGVGGSSGEGYTGLLQDRLGNVSVGGATSLLIDATSRFFYINSMQGTPVGIPVSPIGNSGPQLGKTPITVDMENNKVYFYTNNSWRNTNTPDYEEFNANAGQTIFGTTIPTVPKSGKKSFLQVFVNGLFQQEGDTKEYKVTGSNQITFNNGLPSGADVVIYGFA